MTRLNALEVDPLLGFAAEEVAVLADGGVEIEGVVRVTNGQAVWVRGKVVGRIESNGAVIIDETGSVHGSIKAQALQLAGAVHRVTQQDMVTLTGPLILAATADLQCDAESGGLQMAYGAVVQGALRPVRTATSPVLERTPYASSLMSAELPSHSSETSLSTEF